MQHALRATQSKVCMQYAQNSERYVRQIHIYVHASVVMMQKYTHVYTYVCLNDYSPHLESLGFHTIGRKLSPCKFFACIVLGY